jgi:hypothetical protein
MQYERRLSEFSWELTVFRYVGCLTRSSENNSTSVLWSISNRTGIANSGFVSPINEFQDHRNSLVYIIRSALCCGTCQCEPGACWSCIGSAHYASLVWTAPPRALVSPMCGRHNTGPQTHVSVWPNYTCTGQSTPYHYCPLLQTGVSKAELDGRTNRWLEDTK